MGFVNSYAGDLCVSGHSSLELNTKHNIQHFSATATFFRKAKIAMNYLWIIFFQ